MKKLEVIKFTNNIEVLGLNSFHITESMEDKLAKWSSTINREDIQSVSYDKDGYIVVFYWK